jgi:phosphoglycolate phosphatase-like HAD superfamily hydrolase
VQKIKAVLFDLDNTLIDLIELKEQACKSAIHAMTSAGLKMDETEAYGLLMKKYYELGLESDTAFTEFLKSNNQFDHKVLAAGINAYIKTKMDIAKPFPNTVNVLEQLKNSGFLLGIVTDAPKTKAYQRLYLAGLENSFHFVIGFEDTSSKKQSCLPYELALNIIRKQMPLILPSEVLMVGDSMQRDLLPAKKCGFRTALAKYGERIVENGTADVELQDAKELLVFLKKSCAE